MRKPSSVAKGSDFPLPLLAPQFHIRTWLHLPEIWTGPYVFERESLSQPLGAQILGALAALHRPW
jgi:hypothetical protein